jgi:short subunit dehydrogenase-like uncharacterized protein
MTKTPSRPFDLVLYGATGFVGRLAAAYIANHPGRKRLRWAIAGRDADKLAALRDTLAGRAHPPAVIVAASDDAAALRAMAQSARVVLSTAGPFARVGDGVVDACVAARTHYADITGEVAWVRRVIDRHHARAARAGTKVVPCCGFDSVPSDLGTLLAVRALRAAHDAPCAEARGYFRMMGGFNGGTLASGALRYESGDAELGRDPFLLNPRAPQTSRDLLRDQDVTAARYDPVAGAWVAPFIMAPINTRVVRRSAALMAAYRAPYGPRFRYQEATRIGGRWAPAKAIALAGALGALERAFALPPARRLLTQLLPPGAGPTEATMAAGWFKTDIVALAADGRRAAVRIAYDGDPGNRATLRILCEAGLALAFDGARLPGGAARGGVLTPATALGEALVPRLTAAGFEIRLADAL